MPASVLVKVLYCLRHFEEGFLSLAADRILTDKATEASYPKTLVLRRM